MPRSLIVGLVAALCAATAAQAAPGITHAQARAFAAKQESAWNARDLAGYFSMFTPDAVFVDQTRDPKKPGGMLLYGRSTLPQARAQAEKFLKGATSVERGTLDNVDITENGQSARLTGREVSTVTSGGRTRKVCAETLQTLVLKGGTLKSTGQTDTIVRCR